MQKDPDNLINSIQNSSYIGIFNNGLSVEFGFSKNIKFISEVVFNTSMTGYQEIFTDPSYHGQSLVMTYPLIGNYGISCNKNQSKYLHISALFTNEIDISIKEFLTSQSIPVIQNIDTRLLTHKIRDGEITKFGVFDKNNFDKNSALMELQNFELDTQEIVNEISVKNDVVIPGKNTDTILVIDCGIKQGILKNLAKFEQNIVIINHNSNIKEKILKYNIKKILISNGPGDPAELKDLISQVKDLIGTIEIFGICLGHQIICLALGFKVEKMKFGHRGANHPVIDTETKKVFLTSQNHSYSVVKSYIPNEIIKYENLNDSSIEGILCEKLKIKTTQFHPESSPGTNDANFIFKEWFGFKGTQIYPNNSLSKGVKDDNYIQNDKKTILVIGSGAIVIGQSAEFDYAGVQGLIALRDAGYHTVVLNNNPATIMTDEIIADKIYMEPINLKSIEKIIKQEKIDFILPTFGGQTGLNIALKLHESEILEKYNVKFIGINIETIKLAEDRKLFSEFLISIGENPIPSKAFNNVESALHFAKSIQFPVMIRAAFTLGGTGSGIVNSEEEFIKIAEIGLSASEINQIIVEKSIYGYNEIEYEVIRDSHGTCIIICNMENIDPVGIHTGESIVVTPSQTLSDEMYQKLRTVSIKIVNNLKVEGACNVQLAISRDEKEYFIIEVNPRLSRSSALASKATGYPIAKIAANIAIGKQLHEMKNFITGVSSAASEPVIDYIVLKIPKWNFEKLKVFDHKIGTQMQSTGEIMIIDSCFEGCILKGIISIYQDKVFEKSFYLEDSTELLKKIKIANSKRLIQIVNLIINSVKIEEIQKLTQIHIWFLGKIENLALILKKVINKEILSISDIEYALKIGIHSDILNKYCKINSNFQYSYKKVDSCSGEFKSNSNYLYSSYVYGGDDIKISEKSILVIGSGANSIGQGIEFDYSCVHIINEIKKNGFKAMVLNNNPETLSTDFNVADYLFFDPIKAEYVQNIITKFNPYGIIFQCGGQMALKMAFDMQNANIPTLGTAIKSMIRTENRYEFQMALQENDILYPKTKIINSISDFFDIKIEKYPVILRPSFVIGGNGIKIIYNEEELENYFSSIDKDSYPVVADDYINGLEVEIDGVSDGKNVFIPAILEHIEESGIHSGDSISIYPDNLTQKMRGEILNITQKICITFNIIGFINIQFIIKDEQIFVIEVNPRASRTIPVVTKIMKVEIVKLALDCMLGKNLEKSEILPKKAISVVKVPIFSTHKIPQAFMNLSSEMKSTGEVIGIGKTMNEAFYKGFTSAGYKFHIDTKILILVKNKIHFNEIAYQIDKSFKNIEIFVTQDYENSKINFKNLSPYDIFLNLTKNNFNYAILGNIQYFSNINTFMAYSKAYNYFLNQQTFNILSADNYF